MLSFDTFSPTLWRCGFGGHKWCPSHDLPLAEKCNGLGLSVQLGEGTRIPYYTCFVMLFYV